MKKPFHLRKIDNLGRIVIPMDIRKALEIKDWDDLKISLNGNEISITKAHDSCTFCGAEESLVPFGEKFVCQSCLAKLKEQ